jgi:hypothetical protein|nr:hypothetical protein [uncultured Prevotella sp.]
MIDLTIEEMARYRRIYDLCVKANEEGKGIKFPTLNMWVPEGLNDKDTFTSICISMYLYGDKDEGGDGDYFNYKDIGPVLHWSRYKIRKLAKEERLVSVTTLVGEDGGGYYGKAYSTDYIIMKELEEKEI